MLSPCAQYSYIAGITEWKKGFATRARMGLKRSRQSRCVCHLSELEMEKLVHVRGVRMEEVDNED